MNARNLEVKAVIKNVVLLDGVEYAKMYSNKLKNGKIRVKLYYLMNNNSKMIDKSKAEALKAKLEKLNVGEVKLVEIKNYGRPEYSLAVYVEADKVK